MDIYLVLSTAALAVLLAVIVSMRQDMKKKEAIIAWCDGREEYFLLLVDALEAFQSIGWTSFHNPGAIDGFWKWGRFGPNGPREFVPSATGIEQIQRAMELMEARDRLMKEIRVPLLAAFGGLKNWERTHPIPDYGIPEPPRAKKNSALRRVA